MYTLSLILAIISIISVLFGIYYITKITSNNSYSTNRIVQLELEKKEYERYLAWVYLSLRRRCIIETKDFDLESENMVFLTIQVREIIDLITNNENTIPVLKIDTSDLDEKIKAINSSIEKKNSNLKCSVKPHTLSSKNHLPQLITNLSKNPNNKQLIKEFFLSIYFIYLKNLKYPEEALLRTNNDVKAIRVAISKKYREKTLSKNEVTKA